MTINRPSFFDPEVMTAYHGGGVVEIPPRRLFLPGIFGFCGGVLNAIKALDRILNESDLKSGKIWLLGEIIHNDTVTRDYKQRGVCILNERAITRFIEYLQTGDTAVIPAFGLPLTTETRLREVCQERQVRIVDTTCCYVRRIWHFVQKQASSGRTVLIHGQPTHPETRAILSRAWGPGNAAVLIPNLTAASALVKVMASGRWAGYPKEMIINPKKLDWKHLALVHQTTMLYDEARELETLLKIAAMNAGGKLVSSDTICRATQERQNAALELCRMGCDLFLVIGGFSSSNTTQLYRLAKQFSPAYFIRGATDFSRGSIHFFIPDENRMAIRRGWLKPEIKIIGLLAGASCPAQDIGGVIRKFTEIQKSTIL